MESSRIGAVTSMAPLRNALSAAVMELLVTPRLSTKSSKYFIGTLAEESMKTTTISPARTAWDEAAFPEPEDENCILPSGVDVWSLLLTLRFLADRPGPARASRTIPVSPQAFPDTNWPLGFASGA